MENSPFSFDDVPVAAPFNCMLAPEIAMPDREVTLPVMVFWACANRLVEQQIARINTVIAMSLLKGTNFFIGQD